MDFGSIIGYVIGAICILGVGMEWHVRSFIDIPGMAIVFGGAFANLFVSQNLETLAKMPKNARLVLKRDRRKSSDIIKEIIELSSVARRDGILALESYVENVSDPFMRRGLRLAIDGTDPDVLHEIMDTEMKSIALRHAEAKKPWDNFRAAGPTWGALGTVLGLVTMLKGGVDDPNMLAKGMAMALCATFYGSFIASLLVGPLCDKLGLRNAEEMLHKTIMMKGVLSIQNGDNPRMVESKLTVFLPPAEQDLGGLLEHAA